MQALLWNRENLNEVREFVGITYMKFNESLSPALKIYNVIDMQWAFIPDGFYIMKGIKGECYPCSPEIFDSTYDVV